MQKVFQPLFNFAHLLHWFFMAPNISCLQCSYVIYGI